MQDLVDTDIFVDAKKVIQCLRNKDCSEALSWCAENKSKLKKAKVHI
jgi:macrophage erythroblast attacher